MYVYVYVYAHACVCVKYHSEAVPKKLMKCKDHTILFIISMITLFLLAMATGNLIEPLFQQVIKLVAAITVLSPIIYFGEAAIRGVGASKGKNLDEIQQKIDIKKEINKGKSKDTESEE